MSRDVGNTCSLNPSWVEVDCNRIEYFVDFTEALIGAITMEPPFGAASRQVPVEGGISTCSAFLCLFYRTIALEVGMEWCPAATQLVPLF